MSQIVNPQDPPPPFKLLKSSIGEVPCTYENFRKYDEHYHLFVRVYCGDVQVMGATPEALIVCIPHNHETGMRPHNEAVPFAQPASLWVGAAKGEV